MPKYKNSKKAVNDSDAYSELFERRGVTKIEQFRTMQFEKHTDVQIETIRHVWSQGDKFYKLSYQYYGNIDCWWLIAYFNSLPTEAHLTYGDIILIPVPLAEAKKLFGES